MVGLGWQEHIRLLNNAIYHNSEGCDHCQSICGKHCYVHIMPQTTVHVYYRFLPRGTVFT